MKAVRVAITKGKQAKVMKKKIQAKNRAIIKQQLKPLSKKVHSLNPIIHKKFPKMHQKKSFGIAVSRPQPKIGVTKADLKSKKAAKQAKKL